MKSAKEILEQIRQAFSDEAPAAEAQPVALMEYKLEDGTEIMVSALEVGGEVKIGDTPAPAGTHKLEDGSSIVLDEAGIITEVIPAPEATAQEEGPLDAPAPVDMAKEFSEMKEAFNSHAQAFEAYKESVSGQFSTLSGTIQKQDGIISQLLELATQLTNVPDADPPVVTKSPSAFSRVESKKSMLDKYAEAAQKLKEQA